MPLVTVVVPVYNAAATLHETVRSVLAQTCTAFELVLVDDGSTDGSAALCAEIEDPRVRTVRQPNRGLPAARNAGVRVANADVVAFLDADDRFHPDKLARHLAHLRDRPEVGLSVSRSRLIDAAGRPMGPLQGLAGPISAQALLLDNPVGNGSAAVARRAALDAIATPDGSVFDETLCAGEDVDVWWRIALTTPYTVEGLPDVLTDYRQQPGTFSVDTARMRRGWEAALDKARAYAPAIVADVERPARARMLRYLAGRAVAARDGRAARALLRDALVADLSLLRAQPRQVALTALAAIALGNVPPSVLDAAERIARRLPVR